MYKNYCTEENVWVSMSVANKWHWFLISGVQSLCPIKTIPKTHLNSFLGQYRKVKLKKMYIFLNFNVFLVHGANAKSIFLVTCIVGAEAFYHNIYTDRFSCRGHLDIGIVSPALPRAREAGSSGKFLNTLSWEKLLAPDSFPEIIHLWQRLVRPLAGSDRLIRVDNQVVLCSQSCQTEQTMMVQKYGFGILVIILSLNNGLSLAF